MHVILQLPKIAWEGMSTSWCRNVYPNKVKKKVVKIVGKSFHHKVSNLSNMTFFSGQNKTVSNVSMKSSKIASKESTKIVKESRGKDRVKKVFCGRKVETEKRRIKERV